MCPRYLAGRGTGADVGLSQPDGGWGWLNAGRGQLNSPASSEVLIVCYCLVVVDYSGDGRDAGSETGLSSCL